MIVPDESKVVWYKDSGGLRSLVMKVNVVRERWMQRARRVKLVSSKCNGEERIRCCDDESGMRVV